ncbi:MAG: hypothetical protein V1686_01045 [Patescibacteria group bacterium]
MSHYSKKQLKIGIVYLVIIAIIVVGIYFINRPTGPTCSDGIKNQNEEDIDCGGLCGQCQKIDDLQIILEKFISTTNSNYDLIVKIKNPNIVWAVESADYQINLYDASDQLIGTKTNRTYILPQETKYIVEQKFFSEKQVAKIETKLSNIIWKKLSEFSDLDIRNRKTEYQILENGFSLLVGSIENKTSYDLDKIEVVGVLFNGQNEIIAVGKTLMNTFLRNESRGFEMIWPYIISEEVKSFDVRPYTNIFLDENFIKTQDGQSTY